MASSRSRRRDTLPVAPRGSSGTRQNSVGTLGRGSSASHAARSASASSRPAGSGPARCGPARSGPARSGSRDHVGDRTLPEHLVAGRDHRGGPDPGLGEQELLDLPRVDLLAAPVDHVVGAAGQEQIAVLVQVAKVAGLEPAVRVDGADRAARRVLRDDARSPDLHPADLAGRARPEQVPVPADHPDLGSRGPAAAGLARPVQRVGGDHAGRLGHAVGLYHRDAERLLEPPQRRGGQRSRGRTDEADSPRRRHGGIHGQDRDDRGHRVDPGDLPCLDQLPEAAPAELAVDHQAGSRGQGAEQPDHLGVDVEQGQAAVAAVGRGQPVVRGDRTGHVHQLTLTQQDALGRPGRPARAQEDPAPAGRRRGRHRSGRGRLARQPEHGEPRLEVVPDQRQRLRHLQHPRHVAGRCAGIKRDRYPARRHDADQGAGVAEHVRQPDRHPGARRYPGLVQVAGPGPHGVLQPGVGQRRGAGRVLEVGGVTPAGGRLVDLLYEHSQVPF